MVISCLTSRKCRRQDIKWQFENELTEKEKAYANASTVDRDDDDLVSYCMSHHIAT